MATAVTAEKAEHAALGGQGVMETDPCARGALTSPVRGSFPKKMLSEARPETSTVPPSFVASEGPGAGGRLKGRKLESQERRPVRESVAKGCGPDFRRLSTLDSDRLSS